LQVIYTNPYVEPYCKLVIYYEEEEEEINKALELAIQWSINIKQEAKKRGIRFRDICPYDVSYYIDRELTSQ